MVDYSDKGAMDVVGTGATTANLASIPTRSCHCNAERCDCQAAAGLAGTAAGAAVIRPGGGSAKDEQGNVAGTGAGGSPVGVAELKLG